MIITTDRSSAIFNLSKREYPFRSQEIEVPGGVMSYIDEGVGDPIVFVHGLGTWSYLFRRLIRQHSLRHRCIAPDHIGFGRSERPHEFSYTPSAHARNFKLLMNSLDLTNITLVVHDLGGPIGLSYAMENVDRIARVVLLNTKMWDDPSPSGNLSSHGLMRWMAERTHLSARIVKSGFVDRNKFFPEFVDPANQAEGPSLSQYGSWETSCQAQNAGPWMNELWSQRHSLQDKPLKMIWGTLDSQLGEKALNKWWHDFPLAEVERINDAGRYAIEERPEAVSSQLRSFMSANNRGFLA